jgi:tetratricopeptide (TPR) repeat protein
MAGSATMKETSDTAQSHAREIVRRSFCGPMVFLSMLLCMASPVPAQQSLVDSLTQLLETAANDTVRVTIMNKLASRTHSNPAASARWAKQARQLARSIGYRRGEADAIYYAAFAAMNGGSYGDALQLYLQAQNMYAAVYSLTGLARTYIGLSYLADFEDRNALALHYAQRALRLFSNLQDTTGMANALLRLGNIHVRSRRADRAADADEAFRRCITLSQDSTIRLERRVAQSILAAALQSIGRSLAHRGQHAEAITHFVRSLDIAHDLGDSNTVTVTNNYLGQCSYRLGSFQQAEQYFRNALRLAETQGMRFQIMLNHSGLGDCSLSRGDHESALMHSAKALAIAKEFKATPGIISKYHEKMAEVYNAQGRRLESLRMYKSMLAAARESGDRRSIYRAFLHIGYNYYQLDSLSLAMDAFRQSMVLAQDSNDSIMVAHNLYGMGNVYMKIGHLDDAMQKYVSSLSYCVQPAGKSLITYVYHSIGELKCRRLELAEAMEYLGKSLLISEELNDRSKAAEVLQSIGFILLYQGRYDDACMHAEKSLAHFTELNHINGSAGCYHLLGMIHMSQHSYAHAVDYLKRALSIEERLHSMAMVAHLLFDIGRCHAAKGEYAAAIEYYQRALAHHEELGISDESAHILSYLARSHARRGADSLALDCFTRALRISERIRANIPLRHALYGLYQLSMKRGELRNAYSYYLRWQEHKDSVSYRDDLAHSPEPVRHGHGADGHTAHFLEHDPSSQEDVPGLERKRRLNELMEQHL